MPRTRLALIALVSITTATACDDEPHRAQPSHPANEPQSRAPASIGYGDGAVPQVHLPPRIIPAHLADTVIPLGPHAALTSLANGGALLLWSTNANTVRPISQLALRAIAPDGTPGPIWDLRRTPGTVRGIDIAMRGDEAMMIWNAEIGVIASQISAERVRADGTLVGSPFGIGTYRVSEPENRDGGTGPDRLGFPARVVPSADGFTVAVRGTMARCPSGLCPAVRVADIHPYDVINGVGGVQDLDPGPNVTLLGTQQVPFTLAVNFGGEHGPANIQTFGHGPLASLGLHDGTLLAAWLHDGAARAIVQRTQVAPRPMQTLELVGAPGTDAGVAWAIEHVATACADGMAVVTFSGPSGTVSVRADEPGGGDLFAWALDYIATSASPHARVVHPAVTVPTDNDKPADTTWIHDGLLVARPSRLELMRCNGNALGAPTALQWAPPAVDATAAPAH